MAREPPASWVGNLFADDPIDTYLGSGEQNQNEGSDRERPNPPTSLDQHDAVHAALSAPSAPRIGRPRAVAGSTGDNKRNARKRAAYAAKPIFDAILKRYKQAIANGDLQNADSILNTELLLTKQGREKVPKSSDALVATRVVQNVSMLNTGLGQKSKHRADILQRVTEGVPSGFCQRFLSVQPDYLRQAQRRSEKNPRPSALETEGRHEEGRKAHSDAVDAELVNFFLSRTHIDSDATLDTRQLTLTQERLFAELHAEMPAVLRRAVCANPSLQVPVDLPSHPQANEHLSLAGRWGGGGFLEAKEYETRLDAELQRLMQLSVYTALLTENLVPERKTEPPVRSMSSRDFVASSHPILAPQPATFWKAMERAGVKYTTHLKRITVHCTKTVRSGNFNAKRSARAG